MKALAILSLIQLCMISIGFALAYWLTPNVVGLATQIIMIGGLLFSPITYPTDSAFCFSELFEFYHLFHRVI